MSSNSSKNKSSSVFECQNITNIIKDHENSKESSKNSQSVRIIVNNFQIDYSNSGNNNG